MVNHHIVWFEEVDKHDVNLVGGKGANLGEMVHADLPIPYGFIVTAHAYFYFLNDAQIGTKIKNLLASLDYNNPHQLSQIAADIRKIILNAKMPDFLAEKIIEYYDHLTLKEEKYLNKKVKLLSKVNHVLKNAYKPPLVAVRSSATAEDLPNASFAGQQETFLNVRGESVLLTKIKECWASLFTERAIFYRHAQGFDNVKVGLAAVVQRMVESEKSGIAFSIDPVTNDKNKIVIEAIFGLGEYIVQGKVTPDHYEVDKRSFVILKNESKYQTSKYVKAGNGNKEVHLNKKEGTKPKITDEELLKLAILVKRIENHYYFPQDIEWAIENNHVYIVQARPITTIKKNNINIRDVFSNSLENDRPILTGSPASPGISSGPVTIILSPAEIDKIKKGDIMVAPQTNPDYVPAMKKAGGIITERGGRTSHAAIVSRELGIPAIVGTEKATTVLKNDQVVTVNGTTGEVFKGDLAKSVRDADLRPLQSSHKRLKTLTKIYVNLAQPDQAAKVARQDVDGIGLLRAEFMIADIGTHPKEFIKEKKQALFIDKLTESLHKFVSAFSPRPVIYRATDFKTNEYKHLKGGEQYELKEENPMLGFRGALRYIKNPEVFLLELEALKKIRIKGFKNLHLMIPFLRTPWELIEIKELVKKSGLLDDPEFKLLIMVEVPSCALNLEEFIKIGVHGVSIGTNDLTMMLLGVDRDNEEVAQIYDERSPVVVNTLENIVKTCTKYGITSSICGQAASDYPEIVEKLVEAGITSVSINPDAVNRTRELIYGIEKNHFRKIKLK